MQCGENLSKLLYFFNISNPLEVVWSHATNSKAKLERALAPGRYVMWKGTMAWRCLSGANCVQLYGALPT
jgi:hypothetical protein